MDLTSGPTSSKLWSLCAGLYMFLCGSAVMLLLSDVVTVFAEVMGLPAEYWLLVVASPTFATGAVAWWVIVERRGLYTYLVGGLFGLATALLTGLLWVGQFVRVWGIEMLVVPAAAVLILFVLGITAIAGVLAALPLVFLRRRLTAVSADGAEHAV